MRFQDLLATYRTELAASLEALPEWLFALASTEQDPQASHQALGAYTECLQRSAETAAMLGLDGFAAFCMWRSDEVCNIALSGDATLAQREALWPQLADLYLQEATPQSATDLRAWITQECADHPQSQLVSDLLDQPVQPPADLLPQKERQVFSLDDLSLTTPGDVDVQVYDAFVQDAPEQAATVSVLLANYFATQDTQALSETRRLVHSFKGTAHIVGIRGIGRFAHAFEDLLDRLAEKPEPVQIPHELHTLCIDSADALESLIEAHLTQQPASQSTVILMQQMSNWDFALTTGGWENASSAAPSPELTAQPGFTQTATANPSAQAPESTPSALQDDSKPSMRVPVDTLDALLRSSSEMAGQLVQLKEHLASMAARQAQLQRQHEDAQRRVQALQLAVDTHSMRQAAASGTSIDPLELDRYNELSSLARMSAEAVDDAKAVGQSMGNWALSTDNWLVEQAQLQKQMQQLILGTRLVTAQALSSRLARAVRQTARTSGKQVEFVFEGGNVALDTDVLDALVAPLVHILRNAVDHGIEVAPAREAAGKTAAGTIHVRFARVGARLELSVDDDGAGYDYAAIRAKAIARGLLHADAKPANDELAQLTLLPGFSTAAALTETSGRGVGMDVVAETVRRLNGQLRIASLPGLGTQVLIRVPASLALMHLLIVQTAAGRFAVPSSSLEQVLAPGLAKLHNESGQALLRFGDKQFARKALSELLGSTLERPLQECAWLLLDLDGQPVAIAAESVVTTRESVVRRPGRLAGHPGLLGATHDSTGAVLPVLDLPGIVRTGTVAASMGRRLSKREDLRTRVLVVDDSVSVRRSLTQLLEDAGYAVASARDGLDALGQTERFVPHVVLTDLEMPEMNGVDFTRNIRASEHAANTPVIMITSRSTDKHRAMAFAAGVNEYVVKPYTDQSLLELVQRLGGSTFDRGIEALAA